MATIKVDGQIITSISGPTAHLSHILKGKPFNAARSALPAISRRSLSLTAHQKLSRTHGKRLKENPRKIRWQDGKFCACDAYLIADWLWTRRGFSRDLWRKAVKKPGITGYDLWIMEACYLAKQGRYFPDVPSGSGGWSKYAAIEGRKWKPPADCVPAPRDIGNYFARAWTTAQANKLAWLAFYGIDTVNFPGQMIIDPAWAHWHYDPKHRHRTVTFRHRFDNFATAHKIWNPISPRRCSGIIEIYVKTTKGTLMIYQQDRTQKDGLDRATVARCAHWRSGHYLARGPWE